MAEIQLLVLGVHIPTQTDNQCRINKHAMVALKQMILTLITIIFRRHNGKSGQSTTLIRGRSHRSVSSSLERSSHQPSAFAFSGGPPSNTDLLQSD